MIKIDNTNMAANHKGTIIIIVLKYHAVNIFIATLKIGKTANPKGLFLN